MQLWEMTWMYVAAKRKTVAFLNMKCLLLSQTLWLLLIFFFFFFSIFNWSFTHGCLIRICFYFFKCLFLVILVLLKQPAVIFTSAYVDFKNKFTWNCLVLKEWKTLKNNICIISVYPYVLPPTETYSVVLVFSLK